MAKNDTILLDGIIDDRVQAENPSSKRDEAFEFLAFEQLLKDFDLSADELLAGAVDGEDDGGIDGFFTFINGHLLSDPESFVWPKTGAELETHIITCKHHDTFRQAPLDNLAASLAELLDFSLDPGEMSGRYSEEVLKKRELLRLAYRRLSPRLQKTSISIGYASRGNTAQVGSPIEARAEQIRQTAANSFSDCVAQFRFVGAAELVDLHRQSPTFALELRYREVLSLADSYVLLASLADYFAFVTEGGKLRRYLFDSNVRAFMGMNRVNEDIRATLESPESPEFWWLNNGVTILATSAAVIGRSIKLEGIQIVNGLQSTESIARYFESGGVDKPDGRSVLVRIVVSNDPIVRDAIIRSTNNQTAVELSSLHATDKVQRDIEDVLLRSGLFYERRKNYYQNLGHSPSEIVDPVHIAAGFVALVNKSPARAAVLRARFMRTDESYKQIFSQTVPIGSWPVIARVLKHADQALEKRRAIAPQSGPREKFFRRWRYHLSFIAVSRVLGTFAYQLQELISLNVGKLTENLFDTTLEAIWSAEQTKREYRRKEYVLELCKLAEKSFGIRDLEVLVRPARDDSQHPTVPGGSAGQQVEVDVELAMKVHGLMPVQPWKVGAHKPVIKTLGITPRQYSTAIKYLVDEGLRHEQRDGVVYDLDGNVLSIDTERVNPLTLELLEA